MRISTLFTIFIFANIFSLCIADNWDPLLHSIDEMIAQEEKIRGIQSQQQQPVRHTHDFEMGDIDNGIKYAEQLQKSVPQRPDPSTQTLLNELLASQQNNLNDPKKEFRLQQIKQREEYLQKRLQAIKDKEAKNPLTGLPVVSDTATVLPFVETCTVLTPNGSPCPGGHCYDAKCVVEEVCIGECCVSDQKPLVAKGNGFPCSFGGKCIDGECRILPVCIGECCAGDLPKPNGALCTEGKCYEGGCINDKYGCKQGQCCDEFVKKLLPSGFPCRATACMEKTTCTGLSNYCEDSKPRPDGSACPSGICKMGVCVKDAPKTFTDKLCTTGPCCNLTTFSFLPKGAVCSNNPCMTGGQCTGISSDCPASTLPVKEYAPCPQGVCRFGMCEPRPQCESGDECCINGVNAPDYSMCANGRCFLGKCIVDIACVGDCCKPRNLTEPLSRTLNGAPCGNSTGFSCQDGQCRALPACVDDCCDGLKVKPTGTPCKNGGKCESGLCVAPEHKCTTGPCCDEQKGIIRPLGFPCQSSPCNEPMQCTGKNEFCPISQLDKSYGTPCPDNGKCSSGKCITPPPFAAVCHDGPCCDVDTLNFRKAGYPCSNDSCREQTFCTGSSKYCPVTLKVLADGTTCKKDEKEGDWKCVVGICTKPIKKPTPQSPMEDTRPKCDSDEACCDREIGRVHPQGYVCAEPGNSCMEKVTCDGKTDACILKVKEDGAACPHGACIEGTCIKGINPNDQETRYDIHVHHSKTKSYDTVTIISNFVDGRTQSREVKIPKNTIEKAKKEALENAKSANEERKAVEAEKKIEAALENKNATAANSNSTAAPAVAAVNATVNANTTVNATKCGEGICCDLTAGEFYPAGVICGVPRNPCRIMACNGNSTKCHKTNKVDGTSCPGGMCFEGKCVKNCVGDCCDHHEKARPDGSMCAAGFCFQGACVASCTGECCNEYNFAKDDGVACTNGYCLKGQCQQLKDNPIPEPTPTPIPSVDPITTNPVTNVVPTSVPSVPIGKYVPLSGRKKERNLEEEWEQMMEKETKKEEERKLKKAEEKIKQKEAQEEAEKKRLQLEKEMNDQLAAASKQAADLKSSNDKAASDKVKLTTILQASIGGFVGLLLIVIIVIAVVRRSKNKKAEQQQKKKNPEADEYYDKF